MPLTTHVTDRVPGFRLVELANLTKTATTIDAAVLALAAGDAEEDFKTLANVEYDDTDRRHIVVGVQRVLYHLMNNQGNARAEEFDTKTRKAFDDLKRVTARKRVSPVTKSVLSPTAEATDEDGTTRPAFDESVFDDVSLQPPT